MIGKLGRMLRVLPCRSQAPAALPSHAHLGLSLDLNFPSLRCGLGLASAGLGPFGWRPRALHCPCGVWGLAAWPAAFGTAEVGGASCVRGSLHESCVGPAPLGLAVHGPF